MNANNIGSLDVNACANLDMFILLRACEEVDVAVLQRRTS